MDARDAAELCRILQPRYAVPMHYAFTGGSTMDRLFLKYGKRESRCIWRKYAGSPSALTREFQQSTATLSAKTSVRVLAPGEALVITVDEHSRGAEPGRSELGSIKLNSLTQGAKISETTNWKGSLGDWGRSWHWLVIARKPAADGAVVAVNYAHNVAAATTLIQEIELNVRRRDDEGAHKMFRPCFTVALRSPPDACFARLETRAAGEMKARADLRMSHY